MKLSKVLDCALEVSCALLSISFAINALFFNGGSFAVLLCGVWFIAAQCARVANKD